MAMNVITRNTGSDYNDRPVTIEVTGLCSQNISKTSNYKVTVPYAELSATMQAISRMGGKIHKVSLNNPPSASETEQTAE
ncbi:MAG: rod-capping linker protein [Cyanobacteria bacterium J083]|nr:MAG: rod-capping linker protein [Cyanobacteria bacterium J083]